MKPGWSAVLTLFLFGLGYLAGCGGGGSGGSLTTPVDPVPEVSVAFERAFPALIFERPLALLQAPDDPLHWFLVQKGGQVLRFDNLEATSSAQLVVDISDRVESAPGEAGLLGMAFHPQFTVNGQVFLSYTAPSGQAGAALDSRISRFTSGDGGNTLDPASEQVLLRLDQPFANHNGGHLAFGPDGYLYIGFGDGGSGGDPQGNAQNTDNLLGAMLRIDVDGAIPYAIPADNPFAGGSGRGEIFAWGLRNPWRFSFDRATGALWAGDVGQNEWEEVDRIALGGNYGWNIREGAHCFGLSACDSTGLIDPVAEYSHDEGCSITGGFVYRGMTLPGLVGTYLYGDFCSGTIWGIDAAPAAAATPRRLIESTLNISSFAEGNDGELYAVDFTNGTIWRIVAKPTSP